MSESQVRYAKGALIVLWVFAAASFFMPAGSMRGFGQFIFWVMLVAHAAECALFWRVLRRTGKPILGQSIQILLFGVVHYQTINKGQAGR